jgi:hypothetical protein
MRTTAIASLLLLTACASAPPITCIPPEMTRSPDASGGFGPVPQSGTGSADEYARCKEREADDRLELELREAEIRAKEREAARLAQELQAMPEQEKQLEKPTLSCNTGPARKTVGGSPWLIYACEDQKSVVLVSAPGSPAMPFIFMLHRNESGYRLTGEGTGSKAATEATYKVLNAMTEADIGKLHAEARASAKE